MITRHCGHCGQPLTPTPRPRKYCGSPCQSRAYNARRKADGRLKAYRERPEVKARQKQWMDAHRAEYGHDRECLACGTRFRTRHGSRYCSRECGRWSRALRYCNVPAEHPGRSTRIPFCRLLRQARKPRFAGARCRECGTTFIMDRKRCHSLHYAFCAVRCQRRYHKALRSYRQRADLTSSEHVGRLTIYERDHWRCGLCGHKARRDVSWNHPLAPTLDHIIPLARGGTHESRNVHCAHRQCNAAKSDRGGGEQLALL